MSKDTLFSTCPVCAQEPLLWNGESYRCGHCGITLKQKAFLGFKFKDQYVTQAIGDDYSVARLGIASYVFTRSELENFSESVYSDQELAVFAEGNFDNLTMPSSTLAQILLEQLHETCYIQVKAMRQAHGPVLDAGGNWIPEGVAPTGSLIWQDKGNLFLTDARIIFPGNTFTFIRMNRKLVGLKTFENGFAVQRKGQDYATYFVGCQTHQAALIGAYIQGRIPTLRR